MSFLSPLSLIWLLPLGAFIVLLYLLKLKRKERTVSSILLWQDAVADIQANAPFQKLKNSLLLLLQLLVLAALVFAVSRPYVRAKGIGENRIVVILDASASMKSTDVSPTRFEQAKSRALDIVKRMGSGDTMLVVTAGSKTRVVAASSSDKKALSSAIASLQPVDTNCNMRQAMVLALSMIGGKQGTPPRIVVISDGGFSDMPNISSTGARLDFIRIGRRNDNVAITGLSSRKTLSGRQQVFIGLKSFCEQTRRFNLALYLDDKLIDIRDESLKPGEARQEILEGVDQVGGRVTARLEIKDDLAADNFGSVYVTTPRKTSVLLVSKGNIFLQNALNLDPRVQLSRAESAPSGLKSGDYDMVVFDGVKPPASLPPGGYLLINTSAAQGPAQLGGPVKRPAIVDFSRNHPATLYVDFANTAIAEARSLKPSSWCTTIIEGSNGPLGVAGASSGRRFVQLSFDLLDSDFPLKVGFPIFVTNCLEWLAPPETRGTGESIRTGQPMHIDVPPDVPEITVKTPSGRSETVRVTQTPAIFDDTETAGVYHVRGKGLTREFACNLASSSESSLAPRDVLTVGGEKVKANAGPVRTNRELFGFPIIAAILILAFEWYAYHKRL